MSRDSSFAYSFLVLPRARREAIGIVWDFCRAVDDVVDEPREEAPEEALAEWRRELARCFEGHPSTPQGRALAPVIRQFDLPRRSLEDLIDGVQMDLTRTRYATFGDLYEYCWRVAGAVGLVCLPIFGTREAGSREYALALGVALQLTNILRDVGADLRQGRVYLPQEDLARFGCTEADLRAGIVTPAVGALLAFQAARAREYFARARALLPTADAPRLVAAEIMGRIYEDLLSRIEGAGYDVFTRRVHVPRLWRVRVTINVWLQSLARRARA